MKEDLRFKQSWSHYAYTTGTKTKQKSNNNRLVISFIRVGVVAKTDDENSLKHDKNTLLFFVCFLEGRVAENIESDLATLKIVTSMQKW